MRGSRRNEYCVTLTLWNGVANHTIFFEQSAPQIAVEVDRLVVNRVVVRLQLVTLLNGHLVQEVSDLVRVPWVVDVPEGTHHHALLPHTLLCGEVAPGLIDCPQTLFEQVVLVAVRWHPHIDDEVDGITHIHVKISRSALWVERAAIGDVHLRAEVRSNTELWDIAGEIVAALAFRVVPHRQPLHQVFKPPGEVLSKVVLWRPVLQLEQHRHPLLVKHPRGQAFKTIPEPFQGNLIKKIFIQNQIRLNVRCVTLFTLLWIMIIN